MAYTKNASPFFVACMNVLALINFVTPNISFTLEFLHVLTKSCYFFTCKIMFRIQHVYWKNLYFGVVLFIDSKWRLIVFQSIQGLCKMSHDNLMIIVFVEDEMTLKTTLLLCDPIVTINALSHALQVLKKKSDHWSLRPPLVSLSPLTSCYVVVSIPYQWNM
jgi:hypothetical protein